MANGQESSGSENRRRGDASSNDRRSSGAQRPAEGAPSGISRSNTNHLTVPGPSTGQDSRSVTSRSSRSSANSHLAGTTMAGSTTGASSRTPSDASTHSRVHVELPVPGSTGMAGVQQWVHTGVVSGRSGTTSHNPGFSSTATTLRNPSSSSESSVSRVFTADSRSAPSSRTDSDV